MGVELLGKYFMLDSYRNWDICTADRGVLVPECMPDLLIVILFPVLKPDLRTSEVFQVAQS
jgi:hypothetical protein